MNWYVIQTKFKKEEEATSYLSTMGVEIFSPLMERFTTRNAKVTKELKPLFPSYIFGKFDIDRNYPLVRWARGVKCILGCGGHPASISEEAIWIIKERTDTQGVVRTKHDYKSNDLIRIKAGPLKDLLGIFERWVSDNERVRVLLNLVGYQPSIEIHYSMIEKVA